MRTVFGAFQFHLVRLKVILATMRTVFGAFQFHLVRLKETKVQWKSTYTNISIPFSTIKRNTGADNPWQLSKFQFHLVRLKERPDFSRYRPLVYFNSI